jgi:hypothetical protein
VSAVTDVKEMKALMIEVAEHLRRFGLEVDCSELNLHLIGRKKMRGVSGKKSHSLRGYTDYRERRTLFGKSKDRRLHIYLLYGMPRVEVISTLAHELTHVWQFLQSRHSEDKMLSEGSCNFASYLVLTKFPGKESEFIIQNMMKDKDPVYGEGYRRVRRYVDEHGIQSWLTLLRDKDQTLPSQ